MAFPPRRMPRMSAAPAAGAGYVTPPLDAWFPVQITAVSGSEYQFEEWAVDGAEVWGAKPGGRLATTFNPGIALFGTFSVNDFALARSGPNAGGTRWELMPLGVAGPAGPANNPHVLVARAATTANVTIASLGPPAYTLDGVLLLDGDVVLVKNQTAAAENGVYVVHTSASPTRHTDADSSAELVGMLVVVSEGTENADTVWLCTSDSPITVGATAINWKQVYPGESFLCEVTVTDTGVGHTVKRLTYNAGINDSSPAVTYASCFSTTGDALPVGWRVYLDPIPDLPGGYWISPAPQYAASTKAGLVSATTQTITGNKTLENFLVVNSTKASGYALKVWDVVTADPAVTIWSDTAWVNMTDRVITLFDGSVGSLDVKGGVSVAQIATADVTDGYLYYSTDYNAGLTLSTTASLLAYKDQTTSTQRRLYSPVRQEFYLFVADNASGTAAAWRKFTIEDGHMALTIAVPSSA